MASALLDSTDVQVGAVGKPMIYVGLLPVAMFLNSRRLSGALLAAA
jgi:hypothetical protein